MTIKNNKYIPVEDKDFFILLRIGLWQRVEEELSLCPDWEYIYRLALEQTVQGLIADGIGLYRKLGIEKFRSLENHKPETEFISQYWNDKFLSASAQVVRRNWSINQLQAKLCALFNDPSRINELFPQAQKRGDSITVPGTVIEENVEILEIPKSLDPITYVILKGQGVALCYPKPNLRCSGDIDFLLPPEDYERAKGILSTIGHLSKTESKVSKEASFDVGDICVELHGMIYANVNKYAKKYMQKLTSDVFSNSEFQSIDIEGTPIATLNPTFNAVYLLEHIVHHLGSSGVALRQLCDWTMFLSKNKEQTCGELNLSRACRMESIDWQLVSKHLQEMHLTKFWQLYHTFCHEYLGLDVATSPSSRIPETCGEPVESIPNSQLSLLWHMMKQNGNFGNAGEYKNSTYSNVILHRLAGIWYGHKELPTLWQIDHQFAIHKLLHLYQDTLIAPFRGIRNLVTKGRLSN